jgi:4-amino-4-deoxy-L-arabinose transferase-like glycosyltransferase
MPWSPSIGRIGCSRWWRWPRWERSRLSIAAILAWLLASVAQGSIELRAAGIVFWASVLLAIALIAAANRSPSAIRRNRP